CALERRNPWNPAEEEFLVAPIGPRGDDSHPLYQWVTRQRKIRFDEERKRLFYVACTRARHELHLLGTAILNGNGLRPGDSSSLLETAWPALQRDFETHLQAIRARPAVQKLLNFPAPGVLDELAAAAVPPRGPKRLPVAFEVQSPAENVTAAVTLPRVAAEAQEFLRPEGSRRSRIIGSAVHTLLQRLGPDLATLPATLPADTLRSHAAALLRSFGLSGESHASATAAVVDTLQACAADPACRWILAAHPEAQSEASWSGFAAGPRLRTLRADRVFRAGTEPHASGTNCFWIIDYKTGTPGSGDRQRWLAREREIYAPQLIAYGRALRALHGADTPLRLGLYYPALAKLDWWDPDLG
ncbi:MAG TPA: PD-(D/E)XK nuclease family protein, partial [Acidobacteriaceae bacterium]|nr:PD-(D/E)XK nuclease family protein [Acidobacteriaceae bacterium]